MLENNILTWFQSNARNITYYFLKVWMNEWMNEFIKRQIHSQNDHIFAASSNTICYHKPPNMKGTTDLGNESKMSWSIYEMYIDHFYISVPQEAL